MLVAIVIGFIAIISSELLSRSRPLQGLAR